MNKKARGTSSVKTIFVVVISAVFLFLAFDFADTQWWRHEYRRTLEPYISAIESAGPIWSGNQLGAACAIGQARYGRVECRLGEDAATIEVVLIEDTKVVATAIFTMDINRKAHFVRYDYEEYEE